ncbi:unnamed protein product [Dovyalis caffra]|uniref:Uncharacterized protein n=1 Tax=Dovyalis caffra TaxID=77055 RepID=A0AAV1S003_9ROSI|nr:unnamed protein product [Dovyalis caffra]
MRVGEFAGKKVQEAKPLIGTKLVETGEAIIFSEPQRQVISRSGDECVVYLTEQCMHAVTHLLVFVFGDGLVRDLSSLGLPVDRASLGRIII